MKTTSGLKKTIVTICFLTVVLFVYAQQTIRFVMPDGTGDGSSWAKASNDIQAMINASSSDNQIWIAGGTYRLSATLQMKEGVNVYGGFQGNESEINLRRRSDLDENGIVEDWEFTHATVLDGNSSMRVLNQANNFTTETVWDGITITGGNNGVYMRVNSKLINSIVKGNVRSVFGNSDGGGIYNAGGTIINCNISENELWVSNVARGGGIYNYQGTIINCVISANQSNGSEGAGIYNNEGTITNCTIIGNSRRGIYNIRGTVSECIINGNTDGGIYTDGGTINNCTVNENTGGGIYNRNGIVTNCTVDGNTGGNGAGIRNSSGEIINCIVTNNIAFAAFAPSNVAIGGGIYNSNGTVKNCIVNKNTSENTGGGIYNYGNGGIVVSCTVNENLAKYGGGIRNLYRTVSNCNVSNNKAVGDGYANGGGIDNNRGTIIDCIVNGNTVVSNHSVSGGGISSLYGTITNCTVSSNVLLNTSSSTSSTATSLGGGITGGEVINCIISGNIASADSATVLGGGIYGSTVRNCVIENNTAICNYMPQNANGGGLYGGITSNCLILNNIATLGGGGFVGTYTNCTFANNTATGQGGGMYGFTGNIEDNSTNCIFWQNNAPEGEQIYNGMVTYSAIQDGYGGEGNINIAQDNDNGGARFVNPTAGDYQLLPSSPCVNKGNNAALSAADTTDLAGNPRIYGNTVDIGAYELQNAANNLNPITRNASTIVYPNPVLENFCIRGITENTQLTIVDINGRIVMQTTINPDEPVWVGNLSKGIYIVTANGVIMRMIRK